MNILIIYPHGNALNPHSGAETRIWNLNYALTNSKFNVSILHSKNSLGFEDNELKERCNVYYYKDLNIFGLSDFYLSDLNPFFIIRLYQIIRKYDLDIIQLEFPWGFLITKLLKKTSTLLIYDSQGIESEFLKIATKNPNFPKMLKPFAKIFGKIYESLVCKFADVIVSVSNVDIDYYVKNYKIKRNKNILIQTPSALNHQNLVRTEDLKIQRRKKLGLPLNKTIVIFHGGLPHPPNQEAFDLIQDYISLEIKNPNIMFVLAGHNLQEFEKGNVKSLGFVDDLEDFLYSADFAIVPVISGSGIRIKCTDYIITALPFITTKKGMEGFDFLKAGIDYLEFNNVNEDFLDAIRRLHQDKELRDKLHKNLLKKSNIHNRKKFENRFFKLYLRLKNLKKRH